jgi:hypothetical protein
MKWRAPSWSWASINAGVFWPTLDQNPVIQKSSLVVHCEVRNVDCTPSGLDPTGEVSSGKLSLSGQLLSGKLLSTKPEAIELQGQRLEIGLRLDCPAYMETKGEIYIEATVYCLRIAKWVADYCLVLRCIDADLQLYERIGILKINGRFSGFSGEEPFADQAKYTVTVI